MLPAAVWFIPSRITALAELVPVQTRPSACSQDGLDECQVWFNQAPAGKKQDRAFGHLPNQHQGSCRNLVQHPLCRWPRHCNPDAWFILDAQGHHSHPILQLHRSLDIEVGSRECHDRKRGRSGCAGCWKQNAALEKRERKYGTQTGRDDNVNAGMRSERILSLVFGES